MTSRPVGYTKRQRKYVHVLINVEKTHYARARRHTHLVMTSILRHRHWFFWRAIGWHTRSMAATLFLPRDGITDQSTEQIPCIDANGRSPNQEVIHLLWIGRLNSIFRRHCYRRQSLTEINPAHSSGHCFIKFYFNRGATSVGEG
jgi:hypothetical protein